ncbi:MAG: glycosidase, partial [Clostridia bacterium]|nr:glycosidase [Clostridia bacterium]
MAFAPVDESLFKTAPCITRYPETILSKDDVPYNACLTFNAGVHKRGPGDYVMIFRNDYGDWDKQILEGTNLGIAHSKDGIHWDVEPEPLPDMRGGEITRIYDPRITEIDGEYCLCCAVDTKHGVLGGMATSRDLHHFELKSLSSPDNRNMVLFPEKINGNYVRL